ncbi:Exonuclease 1 [Babesia sp. Xinjiang]|uniref:Exonuclease 1 n=1 Tax=Babesia sp. Xinjiang TaxID=462227 RepID=UPI000A2362BE|nr:Exonuclease 1 [Babesia sp. Xinjiang]ORM40799.1 Exonuclease 1 [Babesia sp. Xinjiang]
MTGQYTGNIHHSGVGAPLGSCSRNPAVAFQSSCTPFPYYQCHGNTAMPVQPIQLPSTSYYQPRRRGTSGGQRHPPQPYASSDNRQGSMRNNDRTHGSAFKLGCEVCSMYFRSATELSDHIEETHVHCDVEGCDYSAPVDLMSVHALKHVTNQNGESVLESADEIRKWVTNRRNRHPLNRSRDVGTTEDSTLERLLRDAHRKARQDHPTKSFLCPVISKVRPRPSALLHLSDPVKYRNLLRQSSGPYSYRPSLSMNRTVCQNFKRTRTCKFGDRCQYSHDLQLGGLRDMSVTKRPPTLLHVIKNDIYKTEKLLVNAIKTLVSQNFFDDSPGVIPSGGLHFQQFLRPMQKCVSIKNYAGSVVAVDAMCWIHRGMISSAVANVTGDSCDKYIKFIISILSVLLSHKITPIMVFDGYEMPSKELENQMRRERRDKAREEALSMIKKNGGKINTEIMRKCMQAISITPEVIARVMQLCREMNVRVVVAPYEADAQVAYLCRSGIAHSALSEDSDLLAYGCPRVWYKLERDGKADELTLGFGSDPDVKCKSGMLKGLSHRMFAAMCVLSGSDYDNGCHIHGMGIKLAHRFILQYETIPAVMDALVGNASWSKKLPTQVTVKQLVTHYMNVSQIFLHNVVYDVRSDKLIHIIPIAAEESNMDVVVDLCQRLRQKEVNFREVSEGHINPRNGEPMSYEMSDKDRELIDGIQFVDVKTLRISTSGVLQKTIDALLDYSATATSDDYGVITHTPSDSQEYVTTADNDNTARCDTASEATFDIVKQTPTDESTASISTCDDFEGVSSLQKRKLRALIDSSERVVSVRPRRRCATKTKA